MRERVERLLWVAMAPLLIIILSFTAGCGDSQEDFVFTGNGGGAVGTADTGSLVFNFTRAQDSTEVPRETQRLRFQFLDSGKNVVLSREVPFATQITIEQVPLTAVSVRITALSEGRFPLGVIDDAVGELQAGTTQVVNLADASAAPVTFDTLVVSPKPVTLGVDGSRTLTLSAGFSNGERVIVPATAAGLQFATTNENVATVGANGTITGVAPGSATVTASWTFNGVTRSDEISVSVGGGVGAGLGSLTFNFVRAQTSTEVPSDTQWLFFELFDSTENFIEVRGPVPFASQVTLEDVPLIVASVRITTLAEGSFPLAVITDTVNELQAGTTQVVDLSDATITPITFDALAVSPKPVTLQVGDTRTLYTAAHFSNGDIVLVPNSTIGIQFSSTEESIADVSATGLVTGVAAGNTTVTASFTFNGVTHEDSTPVMVGGTNNFDIELVSLSSTGIQANSDSNYPSISADGRFVAFASDASNLVEGDTNGINDVFVRDRQTGETTRVSSSFSGTRGNFTSGKPSISADGRFVAFDSYASGTNGVISSIFVHDRQTGETTRVSGIQGDNNSYFPSISSDGRFVAFQSYASNLVEGDTNGFGDIFVHDRESGVTTLVSVDSSGVQGDSESSFPSISTDGRFVAFASGASNLVAGDTNEASDIFVHDRQTGETTRVSVDSDGVQGNGYSYFPSISSDGHFVAFESLASNLVEGDTNETWDIFVHDRQTGETTRVSVDSSGVQGGGVSASISANGRFVAFSNGGIFVHDRQTGMTDGGQGNGVSASISADGRFVAFESDASNLVTGDANGFRDVFVALNTLMP